MRKAEQHDIDCKAQELRCLLECIKQYNSYAVFKTYQEIHRKGNIECYDDEELMEVYQYHLLLKGE